MSDSDSDSYRPRRTMAKKVKKVTPVKQAVKKVIAVKKAPPPPVKRGRGRPRKVLLSESESSESESSASGSDCDSECNSRSASPQRHAKYESDPESQDRSDSESHDKDKDKDKGQFSAFALPTAEEEPKVWVLVGACASGKTWMLKYIQYLYATQNHFKFGVTYTPTKFTGDYSWAPDRSVMAFDEDHFCDYIDSLKKRTEEGVAKHGRGFKLPHNYVVFDDNNGTLTSSPFMINFISTHRHTRTTVFVLSQMLTARGAVSTTMRANTSFALCWPTASKNTLKGLYDNYGGMMTFDEFKDALNGCRKRKYSCLVLKNSADHQTVHDQFATIKAGEFPEDFALEF